MAEKVASRLWRKLPAREADSPDRKQKAHTSRQLEAFATNAFEVLLARAPSQAELAECMWFFQELGELPDVPDDKRRRTLFVHSLLNHNDFISIR